MQKSRTRSMVSKQWVKETRAYFLDFLRETSFPELTQHGERGVTFEYPEWLIMLIGVVAVKCKEKTYVGIHRQVSSLCTNHGKEGMSMAIQQIHTYCAMCVSHCGVVATV